MEAQLLEKIKSALAQEREAHQYLAWVTILMERSRHAHQQVRKGRVNVHDLRSSKRRVERAEEVVQAAKRGLWSARGNLDNLLVGN